MATKQNVIAFALASILRRLEGAIVAITAGAALAGCSTPEPPQATATYPPGSIVLAGAGATFPSLLYERWFSVYHDSHPNIFIKYDSVGSGEGVRRFIGRDLKDGEAVDFGASDSAMSDTQLAQASNPTLMIPITAGCVVLAYNLPDVRGELKLSRNAYLGIFLGEVTTWDDARITRANPGLKLPNSAVGRIVRLDGSGTTFAFANHLAAIDEGWRQQFPPAAAISWPGDAIRGKGNEGVAALIQRFPGSIGYVGYEFAKRLGLDMATLENRNGQFVGPSAESCSAGLASADLPDNLRAFVPDPAGVGSYPIVTFSWVLLRKGNADASRAAALRGLFVWALQDGQAYAAELGYVPLPSSVTIKALTALKTTDGGS